MFKSKLLVHGAMALMLAPALSACASTGGPSHAEMNLPPEQLAKTATQSDVMLMKQFHFDENGHRLPTAPLTRTEAVMEAGIEQGCWHEANDRIRGESGKVIKRAGLGAILLGLATGIGSEFLPGLNHLRYAGYGAGSGLGSGAFTGSIEVGQARSVYQSYCVIIQTNNLRVTGDSRLKEVIAVPVVGESSTRPQVDWNAITPTAQQKCLAEAGLDAKAVADCRDEALAKQADDSDTSAPVVLTP